MEWCAGSDLLVQSDGPNGPPASLLNLYQLLEFLARECTPKLRTNRLELLLTSACILLSRSLCRTLIIYNRSTLLIVERGVLEMGMALHHEGRSVFTQKWLSPRYLDKLYEAFREREWQSVE